MIGVFVGVGGLVGRRVYFLDFILVFIKFVGFEVRF